MAVITKVKSRVVLPAQVKVEESGRRDRLESAEAEGDLKGSSLTKKKKYCAFCQGRSEPHYWDSQALRRFVNDRGRIVARARTGTCAKHQRKVSKEIKYARHLSLLPFIVRA